MQLYWEKSLMIEIFEISFHVYQNYIYLIFCFLGK